LFTKKCATRQRREHRHRPRKETFRHQARLDLKPIPAYPEQERENRAIFPGAVYCRLKSRSQIFVPVTKFHNNDYGIVSGHSPLTKRSDFGNTEELDHFSPFGGGNLK
jgi:hypothetical protein